MSAHNVEESPRLAAERQARILQHLEHDQQASVNQLATLLDASAATIRRDLRMLHRAGLLERVHGGAVLSKPASLELVATQDDEQLAAAVVARIRPGDVVILEGRQVMPIVARLLAASPMRLIAITNQLAIATRLLGRPGIEVVLLGGKLHPDGYTLPQALGSGDLKFLVANKAFVEVEGVHPEAGITSPSPEEARFKHELLMHALQKTVVAPFVRFELSFTHRIAALDEVDAWITTPGADQPRVDALRASLPLELVEVAS